MLYDNQKDPYQLINLVNTDAHITIQQDLEKKLQKLLDQRGDQFLDGAAYMKAWNYSWDGKDAERE